MSKREKKYNKNTQDKNVLPIFKYGFDKPRKTFGLLRGKSNLYKINVFSDEKGSVLLIALVILVLLTFLGFFSISTTNTEQTLAGNERVASVSFNTAESGVQDGLVRMIASFPALPPSNPYVPCLKPVNPCFVASSGPLSGKYYVEYSYLNPVIVQGYSLEQYQGYEYEIYSRALSVSGAVGSYPLNEMKLDVLWFVENTNPKE